MGIKLRTFIIGGILSLFAFGVVSVAGPAASAQLFDPCENTNTAVNPRDADEGSALCDEVSEENPISGTGGILLRVNDLIAIATGIAAVIIIIVSGIQFMMSHGDPQKVASAKNTILFAVIGLLVVILARSLIGLVVKNIYS